MIRPFPPAVFSSAVAAPRIWRQRPLVAAITLLSAVAMPVQVMAADPVGPPLAVFPQTGMTTQNAPAVARAPDGSFVVVWTDRLAGSVLGRRFAENGSPLDGGFVISAAVSGIDVAVDDTGRFLVAFSADSGRSVIARRYGADGVPIGVDLLVDEAAEGELLGPPAVAVDDDGDAVIAWRRSSQTASGGNAGQRIEARRLGADDQLQGDRIVVAHQPGDTAVSERDLFPNVAVAMDSDGDFALSWLSRGETQIGIPLPIGYSSPIYLGFSLAPQFIRFRRYDRLGRAVGILRTVDGGPGLNAGPIRRLSEPALTLSPAGDAVVSWQRGEAGNTPSMVLNRRYDAQARPVGGEIVSGTGQGVDVPAVAALGGGFVTSWTGVNSDLFLRLHGANGAAQGPAVLVSGEPSARLRLPDLAADGGRFAIVWERNDSRLVTPVNFAETIQLQLYSTP